jgi:hypothetical protein
VPGGDQVGAQPAAGVVQCLVQGAAGGAQPFREHVDRHLVDDQGQRDPPLVRGEHPVDRVPDRGRQLGALGVLGG